MNTTILQVNRKGNHKLITHKSKNQLTTFLNASRLFTKTFPHSCRGMEWIVAGAPLKADSLRTSKCGLGLLASGLDAICASWQQEPHPHPHPHPYPYTRLTAKAKPKPQRVLIASRFLRNTFHGHHF